MEQRDDRLLHVRLEVDQHVAARDQVEPREGRVAEKVLGGEDHRVAQVLGDLVVVSLLDEEPAQAFR